MAPGSVERKSLDPEWKKKLTECMLTVGLIDVPYGQLIVNWADFKVGNAEVKKTLK